MIKALLRVIRRVRNVCIYCGEAPLSKGDPRDCFACTLTQVGDFDDTSVEILSIEGPVYFDLELVEDPIDDEEFGSAVEKF